MKNSEILKKYYTDVCSPLIFINEQKIDEKIAAKIYLYNFTKPEELNNFKKVFQEYLIYYIKNYDTIESLIIPNTYSEISRLLIDKGKKLEKIQ